MDFLKAATERLLGGKAEGKDDLHAKDKHVVIIGGGDTGTDCVGTSIRQGCKSVTQLEILPMPPKHRQPNNPWPQYPKVLKTDYGQEEAIHIYGRDPRDYEMMTTDVVTDKDGRVTELRAVKVKWAMDANGRFSPVPVEGSETTYQADIVLIAMGFLGPERAMINELSLATDARGNVMAGDKTYATSSESVFVAGDMRRGQSLVVWAIKEGCEAAKACDAWLTEK